MKLSITVATIYQAITRATVLVPSEPSDLPLPSDLEGINLKDIDLTFLTGSDDNNSERYDDYYQTYEEVPSHYSA